MEGFSVFFAIIVLLSTWIKPACFVRFFPRRICFSFFTFFLFLCNMVTGFFLSSFQLQRFYFACLLFSLSVHLIPFAFVFLLQL